ncbi:hypothetical protein Mgra_00009648, partial [Meloidogyne graminicola]
TIEGQRTCIYPIAIFNKTIPQTIDFVKEKYGKGFTGSKKIIIFGTPTNQTEQFAINLAEEGELFKTANVPFHFNPRFGYEQIVVRNNWNKTSGWGIEERSGGFPFTVDQPFVLEFDALSSRYPGISIYVNNKFFASYRRSSLRSSFYQISQLNIGGAIKLNTIILCGTRPPQPPPICEDSIAYSDVDIPVNYNFDKFGIGFLPKKKITIIGTPLIDEYGGSKNFVINLGESGVLGNNSTISFNFNPRFDKKIVVRNTWTKEKGWGVEQTYGGFPFIANQPFVLEIFAKYNNSINVNVNYKLFTIYYPPFEIDLGKVSQIEIKGAVQVGSVVFCKKYN